MLKKAIEMYNSKVPDRKKLKAKHIIDKLVGFGLLPSYNYGLQMFNKIDSGEQTRINPEIEWMLSIILEIDMNELFTYYNFKDESTNNEC